MRKRTAWTPASPETALSVHTGIAMATHHSKRPLSPVCAAVTMLFDFCLLCSFIMTSSYNLSQSVCSLQLLLTTLHIAWLRASTTLHTAAKAKPALLSSASMMSSMSLLPQSQLPPLPLLPPARQQRKALQARRPYPSSLFLPPQATIAASQTPSASTPQSTFRNLSGRSKT